MCKKIFIFAGLTIVLLAAFAALNSTINGFIQLSMHNESDPPQFFDVAFPILELLSMLVLFALSIVGLTILFINSKKNKTLLLPAIFLAAATGLIFFVLQTINTVDFIKYVQMMSRDYQQYHDSFFLKTIAINIVSYVFSYVKIIVLSALTVLGFVIKDRKKVSEACESK